MKIDKIRNKINTWFLKPCDQDCILDGILSKARQVDKQKELLHDMLKYRNSLNFVLDELEVKIREQEKRMGESIKKFNKIKIK